MGKEQSTLARKGYVTTKETEHFIEAKKGEDLFVIKMIPLNLNTNQSDFVSEMNKLKEISHPHIVSCKNSFADISERMYYVVMDHCQGEALANNIGKKEEKVLSWIVEICIALGTIHEKGLLHKDLTPETIFLTEFGIVCLGGFGTIRENSAFCGGEGSNANSNRPINYLAPEVFTEGTYDEKSDIWAVGCILFELCTKESAFSAETTIKLMPKIISGPCPSLPKNFSPELCWLLNDMLQRDAEARPTASEILKRPFVQNCLSTKCKTTVDELQKKLDVLRALADGLERIHENTTIGSLAGGVIGAVGGITSIVGLILAPFTLGASLIVTGVGVGVGAVGGITAGASNITNMVNQSSDRKAVRTVIKEFQQKINAVVTWLKVINVSSKTISKENPQVDDTNSNLTGESIKRLSGRAGKGLSGIPELVRLASVVNIGRIAAQASRAVRVAEMATGVLSGLFIAVDIFFIAMDAKEIHDIKKAREAEERGPTSPRSGSEIGDIVSTSDQSALLSSSLMQEFDIPETELKCDESEAEAHSSNKKDQIRSEIMRFVRSVREAAHNLQVLLDELEITISSIPSIQHESELEWQRMELI
ncbi:uncharacterized protein PAE49_014558 [Odontesthes bonariensis]|uniref:uncharacterized protein LOC142397301 n=1 Tax=Odontesthes bonariensis TaxID=219752 RepID=UPI003F582464